MPPIRYSRKHRKSKHRRFRGGSEPGKSRSWKDWMSGLLTWSKKPDTPSSNQQYQQQPPQQYQEQYQQPPQQYQEPPHYDQQQQQYDQPQYQEPQYDQQQQQYDQQQPPEQYQGGRHNRRHRSRGANRRKSRKVSKTRHFK